MPVPALDPSRSNRLADPAADRVVEGLGAIRRRIEAATAEAGRAAGSVTLVAVSKFHPAASVQAALGAGQRQFGENRVQEAQAKFPALRGAWPDLRLHLIGGLQTNKARAAVEIADVIESLDRPSLADAIERAAQAVGRLPALFVQVNIGDEAQKSGIATAQAPAFIADCQHRFGDAVRGLMCIPPEDADPVPHFRRLAELGRAAGLAELSMGMSGDFEAAIGCGATSVRVGTAIFGARAGGFAPAAPRGKAAAT